MKTCVEEAEMDWPDAQGDDQQTTKFGRQWPEEKIAHGDQIDLKSANMKGGTGFDPTTHADKTKLPPQPRQQSIRMRKSRPVIGRG